MLLPVAAAGQTVAEPGSGVAFPVSLDVAGGGQHVLAGTGLRTRTLLKVKVYAYGLYLEPQAARATLADFAGRGVRALERDPRFYEAVLGMKMPMSLRLVMTRNVTGDDMADAFDGALRPRVRLAAGRGMPGGEAALAKFRGLFSIGRLTKGTPLDFTCTPEGRLHSTVAGERLEDIESRALCWALFDVYLGAEPISEDGKRTLIARVPALLEAS